MADKVKFIRHYAKEGITFGSCLAMIISYTAWKSVLWAIIHGLLSWAYVIYYIVVY
ncbi:hypothetical protein [Treponema pedis]|uniref:hypothetical protein n=1 Tax=Treponema pedis TaxID=409322 RepID=UPI00040A5137|nr:hypothetical protein [Treponema pedis]